MAKGQSGHDTLGTAGPALPEPGASPGAVQGRPSTSRQSRTRAHTRTHACTYTSDSGHHEPGPTCTEETPLWVGLAGQPQASEGKTRLHTAPERSGTGEAGRGLWAALGNTETRLWSPREGRLRPHGHPSAALPPMLSALSRAQPGTIQRLPSALHSAQDHRPVCSGKPGGHLRTAGPFCSPETSHFSFSAFDLKPLDKQCENEWSKRKNQRQVSMSAEVPL